MRVSELSRQGAQINTLQQVSQKADELQRKLASGRAIERPSDDPAGTAIALRRRADLAYEQQMARNIEGGLAFLNATEAALDSATSSMQRIRELTVAASNDTLSSNERQAIAEEVSGLTLHIAQVANSNFAGAFLFSGHETTTPAYDVAGNPPTAITYQGDAGDRLRQVSRTDQIAVNITGPDAFGSLFDDLIALHADLTNGSDGAAIEAHLDTLDDGLDTLLTGRSDLGARTNRLEGSLLQSQTVELNLKEQKANIEEVDFTDTIVKLTGQQTALEAALAAIGRSSSLTLLNYI